MMQRKSYLEPREYSKIITFPPVICCFLISRLLYQHILILLNRSFSLRSVLESKAIRKERQTYINVAKQYMGELPAFCKYVIDYDNYCVHFSRTQPIPSSIHPRLMPIPLYLELNDVPPGRDILYLVALYSIGDSLYL